MPLARGKVILRTIDLDDYFDLSKADNYTVQARKVEKETNTVQESNRLILTVVP